MSQYQPGVCNIGREEKRKRYALAVVGFVISALVVYAIVQFNLPRWLLLVSFVPLTLAFEGFYQGYSNFCAGFAAAGVYDLDGSKKKVASQKDHAKDMSKAMKIHAYSIISGVALALVLWLIA